MNTEKKQTKFHLKSYHIILMSCLLGTLFILNSNYVNEKRTEHKINREKNSLFNKIMNTRLLEGLISSSDDDDTIRKSKEICDRGSKDLNAYYRSGDLSKIDLKDKAIECEDKDEDYMKNLIDMIREIAGEDDNLQQMEGKVIFGIHLKRLIKYCMRFLPFLIIFVIGILSIIGWMVCCCCSCCDCCCCCCCCKKEKCKVPFFIFTYIFFALAIGACIYGLTQSNKLLEGLADTECSVMKLMEDVSYGENKTTLPRWIGIKGINNLLTNLTNNINILKENAINDLETEIEQINTNKSDFTDKMIEFDDYCYNGGSYPLKYTKEFTSSEVSNADYQKKYVLDIIKFVGHRDNNNNYPDKTFLNILNHEYSEVASRTDGYVQTANSSFNNILRDKTDDIIKALNKANNTLNKLKKPFDKYYDQFGDILLDYSGDIDKYGKMGVKLVLSILMVINVALAILLIFICCCSMKACTSCCCFRCLFKFCTHILWNILALMMIITLLIGSLFSIIGKVGNDGMSLVSYIVSQDNLNNDKDPFLIGQAQDVKKYLNICLHGDGSLENEFDLGDSLQKIEDIDEVLNGLDNVTQEFNSKREYLPAFKIIEGQIKERMDYVNDKFGLLDIEFPDNPQKAISLQGALQSLNKAIELKSSQQERWGINGDKTKTCANPGEIIHPKSCKPLSRNWVASSTIQEIKDPATIVSAIVDLVENLEDPFIKKKIELKTKYKSYLDSYISMIDFLKRTINSLIGDIKEVAGNGKIFSFVNGKFIGTNFQIVLKYLKESLGDDFYKVGICLILIGFSLLLSVSSTILLLAIINTGLKKNIDEENRPHIVREKDYNTSEERKLANLK